MLCATKITPSKVSRPGDECMSSSSAPGCRYLLLPNIILKIQTPNTRLRARDKWHPSLDLENRPVGLRIAKSRETHEAPGSDPVCPALTPALVLRYTPSWSRDNARAPRRYVQAYVALACVRIPYGNGGYTPTGGCRPGTFRYPNGGGRCA